MIKILILTLHFRLQRQFKREIRYKIFNNKNVKICTIKYDTEDFLSEEKSFLEYAAPTLLKKNRKHWHILLNKTLENRDGI